MSKKAYSEAERARIRGELIAAGRELFAARGASHTNLAQIYEKVGISKTFFYSFFPSKEQFLAQILFAQQPLLLQHLRAVMRTEGPPWREKARKFLYDCCYGRKSGIIVLSIEEEQALRRQISDEDFQIFQRKQMLLFSECMRLLGIPVGKADPRLFGNLLLSMVMTYQAVPDSMPFLFPELADETAAFQIDAMVDYMERLRSGEDALPD